MAIGTPFIKHIASIFHVRYCAGSENKEVRRSPSNTLVEKRTETPVEASCKGN